MSLNSLLLALVLAGTLSGMGHAGDTPDSTDASAPRPVISHIVGETVESTRDYVGMVSARVEVDLGFPVSGTIATRSAKLGDTVRQGDILAQMDPETLEAGAWVARASVVVATQQLASARDAMQRERTLVERGVESQSRLEDAERAHAAALARLAQARAALARAEDLLHSATLRAPFDGVITSVEVEAGASVSTGQAVVRLADTQKREVVIDLSEVELAALPRDAQFEARLLAVRNSSAVIRLQSIDPVADSRTRTRRVHLSIVDPPPSFRIGALVRVLPPRSGSRAIVIPGSAILRDKDGPHVWLVSHPDRKVHRVPVTLGQKLDNRVLVSSGISVGQEVIVKGIHSIKDGQIVGPRVDR